MRFLNLLILIILLLALFVGSIILQLYLSKKPKSYLGLILPALSFVSAGLLTMVFLFNAALAINLPLTLLIYLFIFNIPTFIYLAIYFTARKKSKVQQQLEKMTIDDLE